MGDLERRRSRQHPGDGKDAGQQHHSEGFKPSKKSTDSLSHSSCADCVAAPGKNESNNNGGRQEGGDKLQETKPGDAERDTRGDGTPMRSKQL